jgi:nitrogen regulatory protein PII 1
MKMIRAIIRTNMVEKVADALVEQSLPSMTKAHVFGRGKQKGIQVGDVVYDELPKAEIMLVVDDSDTEKAVVAIMDAGRTGAIGDGKIFVTPVEQAYTVRTGEQVL